MANYANLKAAIQAVIKTNGNEEITGAVMQSSLLSMIYSLAEGYLFKGVATPSTNAGSPDQNVFYIGGVGTYANFGASFTVPNGNIAIFRYNGSWIRELFNTSDTSGIIPDYLSAYSIISKVNMLTEGESLNGGTSNPNSRSITLNTSVTNYNTYVVVNILYDNLMKQEFKKRDHVVFFKIAVSGDSSVQVGTRGEAGKVYAYIQKSYTENGSLSVIPTNVFKVDDTTYIAMAEIPAETMAKLRLVVQTSSITPSTATTVTISDIRISNLSIINLDFASMIKGCVIPISYVKTDGEQQTLVDIEERAGYKIVSTFIIDSIDGTGFDCNVFFGTKTNTYSASVNNVQGSRLFGQVTFDYSNTITRLIFNAVSTVNSYNGRLILQYKSENTIEYNDYRQFPIEYKCLSGANMQNPTIGLLIANGTVDVSYSEYRTSDYIKVNNRTKLYGYNIMTGFGGVSLYDANKVFIATLKGNGSVLNTDKHSSGSTENHIVDMDLSAYSNVCYLRCCFLSNIGGELFIATPDDDVVDYTTNDTVYCTMKGYISRSLVPNRNKYPNFRTPLIRVKKGELWQFTGTGFDYNLFPAVVGYSDMELNNPVTILNKRGRLEKETIRIPDGVNYIIGWTDRGYGDPNTGYNESNNVGYLRKVTGNTIITVGKNKGNTVTTNSLTEGIDLAGKGFDNTVIVEEGTYDLIQEFEAYYGSTFFTNFNSNSQKGLILKNRMRLIFSSGAKVVCNYEGNNNDVMSLFSPFNSGDYGFTIDNLHLNCSRVRYCFHEEMAGHTESYENTIINCVMVLDNTNNTAWNSNQCIGGGFGKHGNVIIKNCIFDSVYNNSALLGTVSYHNCSIDGSKSRITFCNNYIKRDGTFRLSWYGPSTEITTALVDGNSLGRAPIHRAENASTYDVHNTELIEWNNVIR